MKLCLGTVQFGLNYGINNTSGKISWEEAVKILNYAYNSGITILDTASVYGNSESILGKLLQGVTENFNLITKYPDNNPVRPEVLIDNSLQLLKVKNIYGYLFHNFSTFMKNQNYIEDFIKIKNSEKSTKIGFSLYYPSEAEYILKNNIPCDIVQVPYNIFDQRFNSVFLNLREKKIEIHVRSIFLQGLFFVPIEALGDQFYSIKDRLKKIYCFAKSNEIDISSVCLGFVNKNKYIDKIIIGVDSLDNLKNNINNYRMINDLNIDYSPLETLSVIDEQIILPFNWEKK